ncbi:hypothetical protein CWE12_07210 [Aliidiomarina sedimenti]|uniref:Uncharacterized protein n=1 Tax=Aliidiomarina sedimenti TaxID=1933879 RepID=A0ABY0BYI3_9GAMM|nr:hypothetical protein [Aliidiomarina sedimenti]RUO29753.1 hypothetical protein CWE12_07210 [Aliidiomarina sedimenti]
MARRKNTFWNRNKFKFSGLILVLPIYFLYQSLQPPEFPPMWDEKTIGPFKVAIQPLNNEPPYAHHDDWVKDFSAYVNQGEVRNIRQGYVNIGTSAIPLQELEQDDVGILHGSELLQHVHAIAPQTFSAEQRVWVTLQTWDGDVYQGNWELPANWLK